MKTIHNKKIKINNQDIKIGVIGIENTDIPKWEDESKYPNIIFHSPENSQNDVAYEIKKVQQLMQHNHENCDFTIVAYHSGFLAENDNSHYEKEDLCNKLEQEINKPLVFGKNTEQQAYRAIRNTKGIDMFILGHDHSQSYSNWTIPNNVNKEVLVVNGGKTSLTKSVFEVTTNPENNKNEIKIVESQNIKFSDYEANKYLRKVIKPYVNIALERITAIAGKLLDNWEFLDNWNDYYLKQTDAADVTSRALIWYTKKYLKEKYINVDNINNTLINNQKDITNPVILNEEDIDVDIVLSGHGVNNPVETNKDLKYKELTNLYKFSNNVIVEALTGKEIKNILEYNAANRFAVNSTSDNKITLFGDKYTCVVPFGLNFQYDMSKEPGNRVLIENFSNGKTFDENKVYCCIVNDYLIKNLSNTSISSIPSSRIVWEQSKEKPGSSYWECLFEYVKEMTNKYGGVYPDSEADKNEETVSHWSFKK